MKSTPMKEKAPKYAETGFSVFPVQPGEKRPCGHLVPKGVKDATGDPQKVRDWWNAVPSANIGIATGTIFAVDLDVKEDNGVANWKRLCVDHDSAPRTSVVSTPSGGFHLYYRAPSGVTIKNSASQLAPGVDVRGHGGYVVAPPSRIDDGSYEWVDQSNGIADAPTWLIDLVRKPEGQSRGRSNGRSLPSNGELPSVATKGQRNNFLTRWGGKLRRHGATAAELAAMLEAVNQKRCSPPLDEREVQQIAQSVARYEPEDPVLVNGTTADDTDDDPPSYEPFPLDTLPEPIRAYVRASAAALGDEIPPALVAVPTLSVLSAAIGSGAHLQLKRSWHEPATLWTVLVAPSGGNKSPAFHHAVRPVYAKEAAARKAYQRALNDWQAQEDSDESEKPTRIRYRTGDATPEAVVKILNDNPGGVLLARDELGAWIGSFDRYVNGAADLQFWIEVWQGIQASRDRAGEGNVTIDSPAVAVTGTIQPGTLKEKLDPIHFDTGFASRLILCKPPSRQKRWTEADVSRDVQANYDDLLSRLYDTPRGSVLSLTRDAKRRWVAYFNDANAALESRPEGPARAVAAKGITHTARLALILHLARVAGGETHADDVDEASMSAAITLGSWLTSETLRVYDILGLDDKAVPPVRRFLQRLPDSFKTAEAKKIADQDEIPIRTCEKWLRDLVERGDLEKVKRGLYRKS